MASTTIAKIKLYSYQYAYNIVNKKPGYTLIKAKSIFGNYFYLVQDNVNIIKNGQDAIKSIINSGNIFVTFFIGYDSFIHDLEIYLDDLMSKDSKNITVAHISSLNKKEKRLDLLINKASLLIDSPKSGLKDFKKFILTHGKRTKENIKFLREVLNE